MGYITVPSVPTHECTAPTHAYQRGSRSEGADADPTAELMFRAHLNWLVALLPEQTEA